VPPALVGRDGELSATRYAAGLTKTGGAAQPIVFTGLRGMGKTALLRQCVTDAEGMGAVVLYAEASPELRLAATLRRSLEHAKRQYASLRGKIKTAFEAAIRALPEATFELPHEMGGIKLSAPSIDPDQKRHESFVEALETLNAEVRRHDRFLVFAIDEVQEGHIDDLRIIVRFVHLTAGTVEPVLFLAAGLPNSPSHLHAVRTYTERWRYFRIGLLTRDQTIEAIAAPAKERGVIFERPALARLVTETAGYPFFIQEYASAAWFQHNGFRVTLRDVEAIAPGVRMVLESSFYDERFRRLTPRECDYVLAMADLGDGPHTVGEIAARLGSTSEVLSSVRNQLIRKDVVFAPAGGSLEFRMPLTDQYVERHRDELERRAKVGRS
jgi:AAA ATPase domain